MTGCVKKTARIIALALFLCLMASAAVHAKAPEKVSGKTGFRMFDGKKYFYNASGKLVKNQIVRSKEHYHYVDAKGELNKDAVIQMAVDFVVKNARKKGTAKQKLEDCYWKLTGYQYTRYYKGTSPKASEKNNRLLAAAMFRNKNGYCYKYAAAMTYCATVLGFKTRMVSGAFYKRRYDHGWCEVQIGKSWRVLDCSRQRHHGQSLFLTKKPPYNLIRFENYYLKTQGGKAFWKHGSKG